MRRCISLLFISGLLAGGPAFAVGKKGPRQRQKKDPVTASIDAAYAGKISWTDHMGNLDRLGKGQIFQKGQLLAAYENKAASRRGRKGFNFFGGDEALAKFVLMRQYPAREVIEWKRVPKNAPSDLRLLDHSLAVVTPHGQQPRWLHEVDPAKSYHLGRMILATLDSLPRKHRDIELPGRAYVNMPGIASIPRLHVHGLWDQKRPIKDWRAFVRRNGYRRVDLPTNGFAVYAAPENARSKRVRLWPLIALADAKTVPDLKRPTQQTQTLVGDMYLALKDAALGRSSELRDLLRSGKIEISQADNRLVVRATARGQGEQN